MMTITTPTGRATFRDLKTKEQYKAVVRYLRALKADGRTCTIDFTK